MIASELDLDVNVVMGDVMAQALMHEPGELLSDWLSIVLQKWEQKRQMNV